MASIRSARSLPAPRVRPRQARAPSDRLRLRAGRVRTVPERAKSHHRLRNPGLSGFNLGLLYVTFDLRGRLVPGANAVGVIFGKWSLFRPSASPTFGYPKLLLHIRTSSTRMDRCKTSPSDEQWKITDRGPIRANNEFDGEEYDARREMPGWDRARLRRLGLGEGATRSSPRPAAERGCIEPMRVTEVLKPVAVTNPDPGVYIVDIGQGFYGTVRLKVSGPAGTQVRIRSSTACMPDGRFNVAEQSHVPKPLDIIRPGRKGQEQMAARVFAGRATAMSRSAVFPARPRWMISRACSFTTTWRRPAVSSAPPADQPPRTVGALTNSGQKRSATLDPDRDDGRAGWAAAAPTPSAKAHAPRYCRLLYKMAG